MSAAAPGAGGPCWSASASGGMNISSSASSRSARPVAARWTELHLVTQPAPHAAHLQEPPLSAADHGKIMSQQQQQQQQQDRQQDFEFPQRKPPALPFVRAARPHPQPHPLQYGRRSFDIAIHSAYPQQVRARAGGNTRNTSGAFPAAPAAIGTPAFPDHAAVHGAGRHSFSGRREGDGDREWGQGHSQRLRGGTSCQLPEAVAARLRQLLHLHPDPSPAASSQPLPDVATTGGSFAPDAGSGLSHGPAAASTGNCSCGSGFSADPSATTANSSRASSAMAGACSGMLGSCASIGEELSSGGNVAEPFIRCSAASCRTVSTTTSSGGSSDEAAAGKPATACNHLPATASDPAAQALAAAASELPPQPHAAGISATCVLSAVATCPISHTYRLFGRAGDPVLHLRLPGVTPAVLAAAAALSAQSRRWALSRFPCGSGSSSTSAAAEAADTGLLRQRKPPQAQAPEQAPAGGRCSQEQQQQQRQQQQEPTLLVATTLADGCEEDGVCGAAGVDVAVMNFTAATLTMDVAELAAAMAGAGPVAAPPPPLTLTLARPPTAAFPLKATEEAGPGPDGGVDVSAFHVYASADGQQVLLLLVVERPPLMPMLVSPRRLQQQQPRSVTLPVRSGPTGTSASAAAAATAAALVVGSATRSWGRLRRQVAPALLRASDVGTAADTSSFTAALEGRPGGGGSDGGGGNSGGVMGGRQPHALPALDPIDDDPVPSCCRRLLNSSSFTVWAEHAAQCVPAAAAAVAIAAVDEGAGDGGGTLGVVRSGVAPAAASEVAAAATVLDGDVAEPPATPIVGMTNTLAAGNGRKAKVGASSCNLHAVASGLLLSRSVPPSAQGDGQPPPVGSGERPLPAAIPDCAPAHLHMTVTAPGHVTGAAARTGPVPAASKPDERGGALATQPAQSLGGCDEPVARPEGAGAAGACAKTDGRCLAERDSSGGQRVRTSATTTAVAVIPWAAFVSGDGSSGAAPYRLAVPPSPFSQDQSRSSISPSYRTTSSTSASSSTSPSASSAAASGAGTGGSPSQRSLSSGSRPATAARLHHRHRAEGVKGEAAAEQSESQQRQLRGVGGGGRKPYTFFPAEASLSPSAIPSGPLTSEELFLLSMPSQPSGVLPGFSAHHGLYGSSSDSGSGARRFSTAAAAAAADAVAAAAAETTTGWLLAGAPLSFPYVASPSSPSGPTSTSTSSSPSSSPSPSRSPSPSLSMPCSSSDERYSPPECGGVPMPAAGPRAAALQEVEATTAAAVPSPPAPAPAASIQVPHGDAPRRTEVAKVWRASVPGTQTSTDARSHISSGTFAPGSYPSASNGLAGTPDGTAASVGRLGRLSLDSGSAGTSASNRAAVSAADAARMARVRAGWRTREQEWSEREAAWRVTESRWWQQAGGGGLWG